MLFDRPATYGAASLIYPIPKLTSQMAQNEKIALGSKALFLAQPTTETDWKDYFDLRWRVLREPWNQPPGSERDDLDGQSFHLMVRNASGAAVAVGRIHLNSPDEAQIRYMAVAPGWQAQGHGGRILDGLEKHARAQSVTQIVLNARDEASNFYRKHGYQVEGPGETLFGEVRHLRMRKVL